MTLDECRLWAAQAWCTPETSDLVMDQALAEAFAVILLRRVFEAVAASEIRAARAVFRHRLRDPGLRQAYHSNIAMAIHDAAERGEDRNVAAEAILKLLFDVEQVS